MKLCHAEEHHSCFQDSNNNPTIMIVELKESENFQVFSGSNDLFFIINGEFDISCKNIQNKKIKTGESVLIPQHTLCVITAMKETSILIMKLNFNITFCDRLPLNLLLEMHRKIKKKSGSIGILEPSQRLTNAANTIREYINDGLKCGFFFNIKIHEFLFLIRAYYDKRVVLNFFKTIYSANFVFSNHIYKNIDNVKTIIELANTLNYSLSGFEKKFKRVFNISPYQWMQEQKARKIYQEIHCTKKTFAEMAFEYGFSSPSHFNVFCRLHFGKAPGDLRKENMERSAVLFE
jgi:AraC-like DNA-binding protein